MKGQYRRSSNTFSNLIRMKCEIEKREREASQQYIQVNKYLQKLTPVKFTSQSNELQQHFDVGVELCL